MTKTEHPAVEVGRTNAALYEAGKTYSRKLARLRASRNKKATARDVAAECGSTPAGVRAAITFAEAVDRICANCGGAAKKLLLSDHPRLPARVVMQIGRVHADRQRYALAQVRAGRNPFGKPPDGVAPPFDTHGYPEVLSRLARNAGLLGHVADGLLATPGRNWPDDDRLGRLRLELRRIIVTCRTLSKMVAAVGGRLRDHHKRVPWRARAVASPAAARCAVRDVASVRGITEKNLRELPRVLREAPPTREEADRLREGVRRLAHAAERFIAVIRARHDDPRAGPAGVPGTYVTFFRLPAAVAQVQVGRLGRFSFPAGVYAYVGSARGPGGVRSRTGRHLTTDTPRKWNIDWLKPLCTPLAVWWSIERNPVEFDWADVLAQTPGVSFPAPGFGASDNDDAEAHLVRFDLMPSFAMFRRRVLDGMTGHAPVYEKKVENWTGSGWTR